MDVEQEFQSGQEETILAQLSEEEGDQESAMLKYCESLLHYVRGEVPRFIIFKVGNFPFKL